MDKNGYKFVTVYGFMGNLNVEYKTINVASE